MHEVYAITYAWRSTLQVECKREVGCIIRRAFDVKSRENSLLFTSNARRIIQPTSRLHSTCNVDRHARKIFNILNPVFLTAKSNKGYIIILQYYNI